jgi:hypothetical protein
MSGEKLLDACGRIKDIDENSLYCLDYILASIEYEDFCYLMFDYKVKYKLI